MTGPERQPGATGFALRDPYPWADLTGLARAGEEAGYRALFLPEVGARDTLATLAGLAADTDRLLLGTGVVPVPARSPALLAMAAATVQEASGGRLVLGVGTGPAVAGALTRLGSTVEALRLAFAGGRGTVDGAPVATDLQLETPPQIWIAALGPKATRLAGAIADGVILNWCTPERVAAAAAEVAGGAEAAGRDPAVVTIAVYVRAALAPGTQEAARRAAAAYATYPAYRRQFADLGIDAADPDDVVREVILTDPASARDRLDAYRGAGAHLPVVYPLVPGGAPDAASARLTLDLLAPT
jgi:alkanesulfonate monooxygenase SsuD/methylene tetrahydromethanopterin reductase-like flavin-dependent oxidoreductase (luciferase family)